MNRYHFSLGDSSKGPVGFCAAVYAESKEKALAKLKEILPQDCVVPMDPEDDEIDYVQVYINPDAITIEDIDEEIEDARAEKDA